ncbi:MAG: monovalent cation/H(+) antiporter subunit G [Rhizobiaceae bacterium]|nr:monovalent cation/H(+) antiporter subunit G [Rhizobiaceae bacterium]
MIAELQNYVAGILLIVGAAFALVATIGIVRLPDIYSRMHAASKAGTVGSGAMLIALAVFSDDPATTLRAIAAVAFLMLTAPVSAHLLAKAAYSAGYRLWEHSVVDDMAAAAKSKNQ